MINIDEYRNLNINYLLSLPYVSQSAAERTTSLRVAMVGRYTDYVEA